MEQHGLNFSSCFISVGSCLLNALVYVSSLYVWSYQHDRNHPDSIKKRFVSVFCMLFISPLILYLALNEDILKKHSLWKILGLRFEGLIQSIILPLFLTMILFLGPLCMQAVNGLLKLYAEPMYWINNMKDLLWIRNHILAPLSEEFTFRSCMLPLFLQCFSPLTAVIICPLFFGAAHFHHIIDNIRKGIPIRYAVLMACLHFSYTSIFGMYSAYLFYRTGHLAATFIAHAFCNHMGVPNFQEVLQYKTKEKTVISIMFVVGVILWCYLLNPLTEPRWYYNDIFYEKTN